MMCFGFDKYFSKVKSLAPIPLRLALGIIFLIHGFEKLFVITPDVLATSIAMQGFKLPLFLAWIVSLLEFFGGVLLIIGFFTRCVAFFLGLEVIFKLVLTYQKAGFSQGFEYLIVVIASLIALLFSGPGFFSIDVEPRPKHFKTLETMKVKGGKKPLVEVVVEKTRPSKAAKPKTKPKTKKAKTRKARKK